MAEIEKRKDAEEEKRAIENAMDTEDNTSGKIVFRKQNSSRDHRKPSFNSLAALRKEINDDTGESEDKAILKGSKVVMPEYVIGQKVQKKIKTNLNKKSNTDTKKSDGQKIPLLQHLFDEEEENSD